MKCRLEFNSEEEEVPFKAVEFEADVSGSEAFIAMLRDKLLIACDTHLPSVIVELIEGAIDEEQIGIILRCLNPGYLEKLRESAEEVVRNRK